jgi:hypothetical protein
MLMAVRAPAYLGVVGGIGALMRVGDSWFGKELMEDGNGQLLEEGVGLHVQIGPDARRAGKLENSISGQLALLDAMLNNASAPIAAAAARGLVVSVCVFLFVCSRLVTYTR